MLLRYLLWRLVVAILITAVPIAREISAQTFDLTRGSGAKQRSCMGATVFGPGIGPEDLEVTYVKYNSIKFAIKGTEDSILCGGFYIPSLREIARNATFRFSDGTTWTFEDIDKRTNLRALATPVPAAQSNGPAPSPPPNFVFGKDVTGPAPAPTSNRAIGRLNKCVANGKVLYTDGDCPKGTTPERSAPGTASGNAPILPTLQRGSWKLNININGNTTLSDYCGDPLEWISQYVSEDLDAARNFGCTVRTTFSAPGSYRIVVDCPSDGVSENGSRRVQKGRTELNVFSPSAQSITYDFTRTAGNSRQIVQGTRVGSCNG